MLLPGWVCGFCSKPAEFAVQGCTIYVSLFPCHECVKAIIQSGIKEIIYEDDKYNGTDSDRAAKRMLDAAGVKYTKIPAFELNSL